MPLSKGAMNKDGALTFEHVSDQHATLDDIFVAVELLDVDEVWGTKKEKEEKKRKKEENSAYDLKNAAGRKNDKKKDDVEVEGQGMMLFEDEEYVVYIPAGSCLTCCLGSPTK